MEINRTLLDINRTLLDINRTLLERKESNIKIISKKYQKIFGQFKTLLYLCTENQYKTVMQAKKIIKQYGWTQEALAAKIGTSQSSLSTCLNRGRMSSRMLHKIAEAIGCDYEEFFADEPDRSSSSDEMSLYPEGTIDLGYVTLNGRQYRQLFVPAMI